MPASDKSQKQTYNNEFRQETLDMLQAWAGEPGDLLRQHLPNEDGDMRFSLDRQYLRSETIFLADRDAEKDKAWERKHACENIAATMFSLERILSISETEGLEQLFYEISSLQTIHHNQSISMDHKSSGEFDEQEGSSRIHLIKFFIIKSICCIIRGQHLTDHNKNDSLVDHREIRLKHLEMEISNLIREAFAICSDNRGEMRAFQERILTRALQAEEAVTLPDKAPSLYIDRPDKSVKAEDFIRVVYAPWLGKGLLRPHLKELDKSLYQALYKQGVPPDFDELLPKAPGHAAKHKGVLADLEAIEKRRASSRKSGRSRYVGKQKP